MLPSEVQNFLGPSKAITAITATLVMIRHSTSTGLVEIFFKNNLCYVWHGSRSDLAWNVAQESLRLA